MTFFYITKQFSCFIKMEKKKIINFSTKECQTKKYIEKLKTNGKKWKMTIAASGDEMKCTF